MVTTFEKKKSNMTVYYNQICKVQLKLKSIYNIFAEKTKILYY